LWFFGSFQTMHEADAGSLIIPFYIDVVESSINAACIQEEDGNAFGSSIY
jgi:hypothetical protein